ncbi:hypothetical protein [Nocardia terpenica]|uniref:Abi-like protein n=1 Tax=Nocardia terpenica TaxID=455432 RepID=A0A6G9ZEK0_9NOCA|nr:hypothetical protein [Nocardia terpenica]QIS23423.1 hypothetical protein F6W96_38980 [Nocardia terpenica]
MTTYDRAAGGDHELALELYRWNAQLASALVAPLQVCEVVLRNAVSDAIECAYADPRWPWSTGFLRSLPSPAKGYNPTRDLYAARSAQPSTGKVIAELKFVFWQQMFTRRHDNRIWNAQLFQVLPNLDPSRQVRAQRQAIANSIETIRQLRNRVAHHEPVFRRNLADELAIILQLIHYRCEHTATWVRSVESVTDVLAARPIP